MSLGWHPAASIFPLMNEDELAALVDDIRENGLLDPVVVIGDLILDGRNRERACELAGVTLRTTEWDGKPNGSPVAYVLSHNLTRRHLKTGQKAIAAVEAAAQFEAEAKERMSRRPTSAPPIPAEQIGDSRDKVAEAVGGVSHAYFSIAKTLVAEYPELAAAVKAGTMTIPAAAREIKRGEAVGGSASRNAERKLKGDARGSKLDELLTPLDRYLAEWREDNIVGISRVQARRLLDKVQRVNRQLVIVSIAVEARTVESRALK